MANNMGLLVDKIERRIGTKPLNLPEDICKDTWVENVIKPDSLITFSRFYPDAVTVSIDTSRMKNDYYLLDENIADSYNILNIRDIDWEMFTSAMGNTGSGFAYGNYDLFGNSYDLEDVMMAQMRADHMSIFNHNIFLDFKPPNMIRPVIGSGGNINVLKNMSYFPVKLLVVHADNLMTISPTMMETFEKLAICDVAVYLYEYLKYYDNLETVFANSDLKLDTLQRKAEERPEVVQKLEDSYVSAGNTNQPMMICI